MYNSILLKSVSYCYCYCSMTTWNISFSAEYSLTVYFRFTEVRVENCEKSLMLACQSYHFNHYMCSPGFCTENKLHSKPGMHFPVTQDHYICCTLLYLIYDNVIEKQESFQIIYLFKNWGTSTVKVIICHKFFIHFRRKLSSAKKVHIQNLKY